MLFFLSLPDDFEASLAQGIILVKVFRTILRAKDLHIFVSKISTTCCSGISVFLYLLLDLYYAI
jgi:hypothetical protein